MTTSSEAIDGKKSGKEIKEQYEKIKSLVGGFFFISSLQKQKMNMQEDRGGRKR